MKKSGILSLFFLIISSTSLYDCYRWSKEEKRLYEIAYQINREIMQTHTFLSSTKENLENYGIEVTWVEQENWLYYTLEKSYYAVTILLNNGSIKIEQKVWTNFL